MSSTWRDDGYTDASTGAHRLPWAEDDSVAGRPPSAQSPDRLGPYRLLDKVGEGGMGVVYRAIGLYADTVAIKVLRAHVAHDPGARERLRREVSTLARVRSPYVAEVLDADVEGDRPYLVTRFVPGPALDEVVDDYGPLPPQELVRLGHGLVEAVKAIHAAGVVHRDIKPGNVLMVDGDPVLIDFGIAHVADDSRLTMTGLVMGTPGYLSPEIVEGAEVSDATDWWGWAATLAFAASGRAPFGRGPMSVVLDRVTRGQADLTGVDERLRPLLAAALDPDPARRPTSGQVMAELETYAGGGRTGTITQAAPYGAPTWVTEGRRSASTGRPELGPGSKGPGSKPESRPERRSRSLRDFRADSGVAPTRPDRPATQPVPSGRGADPTAMVPAPEPQPSATGQPVWHGDPRIGMPRRSWTLFALLAAAVAVCAVVPVVDWFLLLAWSFVARWQDKAMSAMVWRRNNANRRGSDAAVATMLSPWHAFLAILSTLLTALIPLFLAVVTAAVVGIFMSFIDPSNSTILRRPIPVAAATAVAILASWWGPGGTSLRRGSRGIVRLVGRTRTAAAVVLTATVLVAVVAGWWALTHLWDPLNWWPYLDVTQVPGHDLWPRLPRS